jgi:adenosylmethionine-8-amino-7-oxononanoate aminotransferase
MLENQPDSMPTNKAITATVVTAAAQLAVSEVWPQIVSAQWSGPAMTNLVSLIGAAAVGLGAAWFVKDRAGVPEFKP